MSELITKSGLVVAMFEPDPNRNEILLNTLTCHIGNKPIHADNLDMALGVIKDSSHNTWHGAYIGNLNGEAKSMRYVIDAIRDKYPNAYLIAMLESSKFKVNANERIMYRDLTDNLFVGTLTRMLVHANNVSLS
jgi:hypothetical protein